MRPHALAVSAVITDFGDQDVVSHSEHQEIALHVCGRIGPGAERRTDRICPHGSDGDASPPLASKARPHELGGESWLPSISAALGCRTFSRSCSLPWRAQVWPAGFTGIQLEATCWEANAE